MQASHSTFRLLVLAALVAAPLGAQQEKAKDDKIDGVPRSAWPPAGMCRIWLNKVAESQQPAATDCGTAVRNQPANARLLFGDLPGISATVNSRSATDFAPARNGRENMRRYEAATRAPVPNPAASAPNATPQNGGGVTPVNVRAAEVRSAPAQLPPPPPAPAKSGKPESFQY